MRRIAAGLFLSVDGVAESPDRCVFPYLTEEVGQVVGSGMESSDTMLLRRRTYEEWADYWPDKTGEDDPHADFINNVPKGRGLHHPDVGRVTELIAARRRPQGGNHEAQRAAREGHPEHREHHADRMAARYGPAEETR